MDLIGIDINAGAMRSLYEQTFGEPRYRPHPIQMRMLAEGALGRKSGRGFYDYSEGSQLPKKKEAIKAEKSTGEVWLSKCSWAPELTAKIIAAGYEIAPLGKRKKPVAAFMQAGREEAAFDACRLLTENLPPDVPLFIQSANIALSEILEQGFDDQIIGFDGLFMDGESCTLQSHPAWQKNIKMNAEKMMNALGFHVQWTKESPTLILPRIIAQLVNEAAFAVQEGVADADTIDLAMRLGVNYPLGPLEWGVKIGYGKILNILDHLYAEFHEERYRASTLLRRWARTKKN